MSLYTSIRCDVVIKPEYREELSMLDKECWNWSKSSRDFIRKFSKFHRAVQIPNGPLTHPVEWDEDDPWPNGLSDCYCEETGHLKFQCSINYGSDEIEYFVDTILPKVVESVNHFETCSENDSVGVLYYLDESGEIQIHPTQRIEYT